MILFFISLRLRFSYESFCFVFIVVFGDKIVRDIRFGVVFEFTYIYRFLIVIKSSLFEKVWDCVNVVSMNVVLCFSVCFDCGLFRVCFVF